MSKQPKLRVDEFGNKWWRLDGKLHREDGPAVEYNSGSKEWYQNGVLHREDGPAIEWSDGDKYWWLNGGKYSYDEWFSKLTPEQQYNYLWNLNE
jgi:hypothetical protein